MRSTRIRCANLADIHTCKKCRWNGGLYRVANGHGRPKNGTRRNENPHTGTEITTLFTTPFAACSRGPVMTVKRIKGSPYWHFGFRYQGYRFRASTKTTDRREAQAIERAERNRAMARRRGGGPAIELGLV
jgi:hypothetical protein